MKYLVIAEKPSVSKSIAKVIGAYRQEDGYLEGGDCVVSWCLGHLAEYAAPEHYDERYENWRFEDRECSFFRDCCCLRCTSRSVPRMLSTLAHTVWSSLW